MVPDGAGRAGGNGGVTLQLRYRSGTVSKGFLNRCAGAGVKLSPGAHQQQIAQRRPLHLRKSGDTGYGRGYLVTGHNISQRGPVLAARLKMADASKSGRISPVTGALHVARISAFAEMAGARPPSSFKRR